MIRIGLLRHGRTHWNRQGLLQGQTDIGLEDGEPERLAALTLPDEWRGASLLASPLSRANDTARIVSDRTPRTDPRLVEMAFGDWEGKASLDLQADPNSGFRDIEDWGWDYRPPNGETPREVWARIEPTLAELTEDTLIVCHLCVMRVALAKAHGWEFSGPPPFAVKRDRIYGLTFESGTLSADEKPIRLVPRCA